MEATTGYLQRQPRPSSLADVVDLILDKGLVIDAYVRVSLVGIEVLTLDARVVIASVDTYLRFAEAVGRLDLTQTGDVESLPELVGDVEEKAAETIVRRKVEGAEEDVKDVLERPKEAVEGGYRKLRDRLGG
jgi:gas vesicle structural protein